MILFLCACVRTLHITPLPYSRIYCYTDEDLTTTLSDVHPWFYIQERPSNDHRSSNYACRFSNSLLQILQGLLWLNLSRLDKYIIYPDWHARLPRILKSWSLTCVNSLSSYCLHEYCSCYLPRGLYEHQVMGYTLYRETLLVLSSYYKLTPLWRRNVVMPDRGSRSVSEQT
jgi:hypothetical protein